MAKVGLSYLDISYHSLCTVVVLSFLPLVLNEYFSARYYASVRPSPWPWVDHLTMGNVSTRSQAPLWGKWFSICGVRAFVVFVKTRRTGERHSSRRRISGLSSGRLFISETSVICICLCTVQIIVFRGDCSWGWPVLAISPLSFPLNTTYLSLYLLTTSFRSL